MPRTERYRNVGVSSPAEFRFEQNDPNAKLARRVDMKTGSYGSRSAYSDPRIPRTETNNRYRGTDHGFGRGSWNWTGDGVEEASRRSTNKAVDVEARTVPGSTRQTLSNRGRVAVTNAVDRFGKGVSAAKGAFGGGPSVGGAAASNASSSAASSAASAVGKGASAVARGVSSSASGGPSVGIYGGGVGVGVSRGGLDLGVGFASVSWNFSNPNESSIGGAFNTLTITGTQEGCTIYLNYKFLGKTYFTETRQADECEKPEPEPPGYPNSNEDENEPEPSPEPSPSPGPGMTTSRTTSSVNYSFADPVNIYISGTTKSSPGRGSPAQPIEYSPIYGYIATLQDFRIDEVSIYREIPFWTANGEYSGSLYFFNSEFTIIPAGNVYPVGTFGKTRWRVVWSKFTLKPDPIVFFDLLHNEPRFNFYPLSRDPAFPLNNPILDYAGCFYRSPYNSRMKAIFRPVKPELPKRQTTPTPRAMKPEQKQQILVNRIYQMLGGDTFYKEGIAIPNEMFTPEGEGYTRTKSYNGVAHLLFDTLDHRTPGQVKYLLPNGMHFTSINAQGYYEELGKNIAELINKEATRKDSNSEVMRYVTRLALINIQILKVVIKANEAIKAIMAFLNIPTRKKTENVEIPFDPTVGGKVAKGFGSRSEMDAELQRLINEQGKDKNDPEGKKLIEALGSDGAIPVVIDKIRESKEGGDFWWFLRNNLK